MFWGCARHKGNYNVLMWCLLVDILVVFRWLQNTFQKDDILITEVVSARESAVMKLEMMADMTFANGKEMRYLAEMECDLTAVSDLKKKWEEDKHIC